MATYLFYTSVSNIEIYLWRAGIPTKPMIKRMDYLACASCVEAGAKPSFVKQRL